MQSFVSLKSEPDRLDNAVYGSNGCGPMAFLRPVKGIKPLVLDLSWRFVSFLPFPPASFRLVYFPPLMSCILFRPFNFGKSIPTDEDVAGILKPIQPEGELPEYRDSKYGKTTGSLLNLAVSSIAAGDDQSTLSATRSR